MKKQFVGLCPKFPRRRPRVILRNRAYIGEVSYKDQWHPGTHEPIVDRYLFDLVQAVLGEAGW